jgi:hypothetical protein
MLRALLLLWCACAGARTSFHTCVLTSSRPNNASYVERAVGSLRDGGFARVTVVDAQSMGKHRKLAQCVDDGRDVDVGVPCKVLQSNYDVAMALWHCDARARKAKWLLFVEDDMEACEGALRGVRSALRRATSDAVQFSKFSRAFAVRRGAAVLELVANIRCQAQSLPYDVVLWNTFTQPLRTRNLFHHVGSVSTVQYRNKEHYVKRYSDMRSDVCGQPL